MSEIIRKDNFHKQVDKNQLEDWKTLFDLISKMDEEGSLCDVEWEWKNNQTNIYLGSLEEGRLDNLNEIIDLSIKLNLPKKYGSENIYFDFDEITLTDCKEVQ
tara:strand:- start:354 stop:662 length:309 start_codon:yes stop_codon:yes gene_type:complete